MYYFVIYPDLTKDEIWGHAYACRSGTSGTSKVPPGSGPMDVHVDPCGLSYIKEL